MIQVVFMRNHSYHERQAFYHQDLLADFDVYVSDLLSQRKINYFLDKKEKLSSYFKVIKDCDYNIYSIKNIYNMYCTNV